MRFREFNRTDEIAPVVGAVARNLAGKAVAGVGQAAGQMVGQAASNAANNMAQKATGALASVGTVGSSTSPAAPQPNNQQQSQQVSKPASTQQRSAQQQQQQQQQAQVTQQTSTNLDKIAAQIIALKQQLAQQRQ